MDFSNGYVLGFAAALCLVCSFALSGLAGLLDGTISANKKLDKQRQVILVAGRAAPGDPLPQEKVDELFADIEGKVIDRLTGEYIEGVEASEIDLVKEAKDPALSVETPKEAKTGAKVPRLPNRLTVFEVNKEGKECIVMPIHGKGLWSTMYGYLALSPEGTEVVGITFYQHGETPGLGGEIDNKQWQKAWIGRGVYGPQGDIKLGVVKKSAPRDTDYQVDGLSGATITTVGVDATIKLWLGDAGYGPYLAKLK